MAAKVTILPMFAKTPEDAIVVNTTSKSSSSWERDLSPFHLGPCELYQGYECRRMENGWQFAKVYRDHLIRGTQISQRYWLWATRGWNDGKPHRYPMGKGAVPEFSLWDGERLDYIEARKQIYVPLYARAVVKTKGFAHLTELVQQEEHIVLRDFDGYNHDTLGLTLKQVLNLRERKMGHAFVLKMLLLADKALRQCAL